jgi:drug/metabolite transporter (DMT)-like permease
MRPRDVGMLVALAAIWGASFPLTRVAAPAFGPVALVGVRLLVAIALLLPLVKQLSQLRKHIGALFVLGLLNSALPFCLFAFAVLHISSGFAALLNSTTPIFGALLGAFVFSEQLTRGRVVGILIGCLGVATLVWDSVATKSGNAALGILAALVASAMYAVAATWAKRRLSSLNATTIAAGSLTSSSIALLPFAIWQWPSQMPGTQEWICAVVLGLVCTAAAYMLYFRLLANIGVARTTTVTFLVPVFGIAWGALFLHEPVTLPLAASCLLVLLGTALAIGLLRLPESKRLDIA